MYLNRRFWYRFFDLLDSDDNSSLSRFAYERKMNALGFVRCNPGDPVDWSTGW